MKFLYWMRLTALVSSCVTFGLVTHAGGLDGDVGTWCMFCWIFSFSGTLLILLVHLFRIRHLDYVPISWVNFSVTFSSYATLLCLFASIAFPPIFIKGQQGYDVLNHLITAEVFSCLATLAYLLDVWITRVESKCYMTTKQGFLLVWQTYVAGFILIFISNPVSYTDQAAVRWCMAVYCICFIGSVASIFKIVICSPEESGWLKKFNFCAALMYFSATIIWPVFKFNSHYPSQIYPPESCQDGLELCPWGKLIVVTVLTVLNFLLYSLSLCCCCTSDSAHEQEEYSSLLNTPTIQAQYPTRLATATQQYSSDPSRQHLGNGRWYPHNYQSLNQRDNGGCEPTVINKAAVIHQIYIRQ